MYCIILSFLSKPPSPLPDHADSWGWGRLTLILINPLPPPPTMLIPGGGSIDTHLGKPPPPPQTMLIPGGGDSTHFGKPPSPSPNLSADGPPPPSPPTNFNFGILNIMINNVNGPLETKIIKCNIALKWIYIKLAQKIGIYFYDSIKHLYIVSWRGSLNIGGCLSRQVVFHYSMRCFPI